jgi:hypothetical protein
LLVNRRTVEEAEIDAELVSEVVDEDSTLDVAEKEAEAGEEVSTLYMAELVIANPCSLL